MKVERVIEGRGAICERILRTLPHWFGIEQAIRDYVRDVEEMPFWAASDDGEETGFVAVKAHNRFTGEIYVMGVLPEFHRRGVGRLLLVEAEGYLRAKGCEFLTVKTLSPSRECEFYKKTRLFYESVGFKPLEEFRNLWNEANPCLFLAKYLG